MQMKIKVAEPPRIPYGTCARTFNFVRVQYLLFGRGPNRVMQTCLFRRKCVLELRQHEFKTCSYTTKKHCQYSDKQQRLIGQN